MNVSRRSSRIHVLILGLGYFVVGVASSLVAGAAVTDQARLNWRLAAWAASGLLFAIQILYEHFRLRNSPRLIALHAALAVAIGAFGLAAAAMVHSLLSSHYRPSYLVALIVWPIITSFPAFLVALIESAILRRFQRK